MNYINCGLVVMFVLSLLLCHYLSNSVSKWVRSQIHQTDWEFMLNSLLVQYQTPQLRVYELVGLDHDVIIWIYKWVIGFGSWRHNMSIYMDDWVWVIIWVYTHSICLYFSISLTLAVTFLQWPKGFCTMLLLPSTWFAMLIIRFTDLLQVSIIRTRIDLTWNVIVWLTEHSIHFDRIDNCIKTMLSWIGSKFVTLSQFDTVT